MPIFSFIIAGLCLARTAEPSSAEPLSFQEFFEPSAQDLKPSARLLSLSHKRVRLVGYMAQMEEPARGGFYLCKFPVFATEGGGGTADLPPDAVLVVVKSARGKELAHIPGLLDVTGVLEIGPQVDEGGRTSRIRILLDSPAFARKVEEATGDRP